MREAMRARGPHGAGLWMGAEGRIGLGHRRLAIIDPDPRADQPMATACGRWHLVYNGEIYNWRALRRDLEAAGVTFRTRSDTEVLLHWLIRHGAEGLERVRGMYAFALWDERAGRLWLGRDPFGIKPLYYHDDGWTVRAASQVRALAAGGGIAQDVEPAGVVGFLLWGSVPDPWTTISGVRSVPAGHLVEVGLLGAEAPRPFCELPAWLARGAGGGKPPASAADAAAAIVDSVRAHLEADVPVGLFLSAGLDSAMLARGLERLGVAERTVAITLGFEEFGGRAEDEVPLATELARTLGMAHHVRRVSRGEFRRDLPRILAAMDQPSIDGVNTWFVAKAAREAGLEVALSGLGGDELFGGYPSFRRVPRWGPPWRWLRLLPGAGPVLRAALAHGPARKAHPKLAGFGSHAGSFGGAYRLVRGLFLPHELPRLVAPEIWREGLRRLGDGAALERLARSGPATAFARVSTLEACWYMRHQLLRDTDWASMARSLEVRVPFVDLRLWERLFGRGPALDGKSGVARALGLPEHVLERPKTGFVTPLERWIEEAAEARTSEPMLRPWARRWALRVLDHFVGPNAWASGEVAEAAAPSALLEA